MRAIAFSVDVDRDVNLACKGQACSISKSRNGDSSPRFTSSAHGLELILEVLNDSGIKGTFFWEGRSAEEMSRGKDLARSLEGHEVALHGYDHEDFPGKETGVPLDRGQVREVLDRAERVMDGTFGPARRGFRAPYQRTSDGLIEELVERRYLYDSSETAPMMDGRVSPYRRDDGLLEAPVCWTLDRDGNRIVSYLWPYHEGKRPLNDYIDLLDRFEDGLLVIATHSWHLVESFCFGPLPKDRVDQGMADLRQLIGHGQDTGARFVGILDHLRGSFDL